MINKYWVIVDPAGNMYDKGGKLTRNYKKGLYTSKSGAKNVIGRLQRGNKYWVGIYTKYAGTTYDSNGHYAKYLPDYQAKEKTYATLEAKEVEVEIRI